MSKVIGIGNALVDILVKLENDQLLDELALPKGSMQLVDQDFVQKFNQQTQSLTRSMASGGSAANTIHGLAHLGISTGFIGSIGKDELGASFSDDLKKNNIEPKLFTIAKAETGCANTLISPNGERTFATFLGAATHLDGTDIVKSLLEGYDYFHIEGYLVFNHHLLLKAAQSADKLGMTISLDLASYNVVEANLEFLRNFVENHVHILFANEEEAKAFTGKEPEQALHEIAEMVDIAVVKLGDKGSLIKKGDEVFRVPIIPVNCLDTTGAGDLYAAGFLYGFIDDKPLDVCGQIGAILSGNVIEGIGAKMDETRWNQIKQSIAAL